MHLNFRLRELALSDQYLHVHTHFDMLLYWLILTFHTIPKARFWGPLFLTVTQAHCQKKRALSHSFHTWNVPAFPVRTSRKYSKDIDCGDNYAPHHISTICKQVSVLTRLNMVLHMCMYTHNIFQQYYSNLNIYWVLLDSRLDYQTVNTVANISFTVTIYSINKSCT